MERDMKKALEQLKNKSLSTLEVLRIVDNKSNLIKYDDMKDVKHIDDILKDGACVILYRTSENYGHWNCVIKRGPNTIEAFDSYGTPIDNQLLQLSDEKRHKLGQVKPYLSKLLLDSNYTVEFNPYKLQKATDNVATCGRWSAARINFKHLSIDEFKKLFTGKNINSDDVVTLYTNLISEI